MDRLARGLAWKGGAITIVLLVLLVVLWANLNSIITENCTNRIISEVVSPDGAIKAVVFQRNCGIDTAVSTHVSLLPASDTLPNRKGNLFSAEGSAGRVGVTIGWKSAAAIELSYRTHRGITRRATSAMGVSVSYPGEAATPDTKK